MSEEKNEKINAKVIGEPTSRDILIKYIKQGPFKARTITKEETHKYSSEISTGFRYEDT